MKLISFFLLFISCQSWHPKSSMAKWMYQLQNYEKTKALPQDNRIKVIDITYPHAIEKEQQFLCYLSIGEAEDYRDYFQSLNKKLLKDENKQWVGNFPVQFWKSEWKDIIYQKQDSYLQKIIQKKCSGVYLDIVDAFHSYKDQKKYAKLMAQFIIELSQSAKKIDNDFQIYIQNGIDIVEYLKDTELTHFFKAIDGISLEAAFFQYDEEHKVTGLSPDLKFYIYILKKYYVPNNKSILSVEYLTEKKHYREYLSILGQVKMQGLVTDKLLKGKFFHSLD